MRVAFVTQWWGANPEGVISGIVTSLRGEGLTVDISLDETAWMASLTAHDGSSAIAAHGTTRP